MDADDRVAIVADRGPTTSWLPSRHAQPDHASIFSPEKSFRTVSVDADCCRSRTCPSADRFAANTFKLSAWQVAQAHEALGMAEYAQDPRKLEAPLPGMLSLSLDSPFKWPAIQ